MHNIIIISWLTFFNIYLIFIHCPFNTIILFCDCEGYCLSLVSIIYLLFSLYSSIPLLFTTLVIILLIIIQYHQYHINIFFQKSSTIRFFILFINSLRLCTSSLETFSSGSLGYCRTLSWIPSSCSTMFITLFDGSWSSSIRFLSYSFFLLIFSRCSNSLFFLSSWFSTFGSSFLIGS